ncbi:MAG: helix-turn-helix domain-containing protein [Flavobacteriaceae bacterium]|jgi:AcrR family transcriptional regulator
MTEKQKEILKSALKLIAKQGYEATSTRSIAQEAGVSEGLIFRHFQNKEGLLTSILKDGQQKLEKMIQPIESLTHPKVILKHIISLPFNLAKDQMDFWKVFYSLRWQMKLDQNDFADKLNHKVKSAFEALDFNDSQSESETFMMIWDGAMEYVLLNDPKNSFVIFETLLSKYDL